MTEACGVDIDQARSLLVKVKDKTGGCLTLEEAARHMTNVFYDEHGDLFALVRMFATVPFGKLPSFNRAFVSNVVETHNLARLLTDDTPVLSLLATRGVEAAWNDRHRSQGHVGIPLVSAAFVDELPMVSRLLKEVGMDLDWIGGGGGDMSIDTMGLISGLFYVEDARTAVDNQVRKLIPAQDFVDANHVRTVFGLAGGYATSRTFVVLIVFCRARLEKTQAELFVPAITSFEANTMAVASSGAIFAE